MDYQILIDNYLYESSSKKVEARHLYDTIKNTCLHQYFGHIKTLFYNGRVIKSDIINHKYPVI